MIVHNIDTLDQLSNGQIGILVDCIQTKDKKIEILIIKLRDQSAGGQNKSKHPNLSKKHPWCLHYHRSQFLLNMGPAMTLGLVFNTFFFGKVKKFYTTGQKI